MHDQNASVWLKGARPAVFIAVAIAGGLTALFSLWLVGGQVFAESPISVPDVLHPSRSLTILLFLLCAAATVILAGIYLSDFQGSIEQAPTGPMDIVSLVLGRICMVLIAFVVIVMFYEVVVRYIFEKPTLWANELSLWTAGVVFLLSGLYAMQQRSHIRIYVIYDLMPRWAQKASDVFTVLLIWLFATAMLWGGYNEARDKFLRWETLGTAFDPPIPATVKPMLLILVFLVALQALSNLIADWHKAPEHHSPLDDIDEAEIEELKKKLAVDE